VPGQERFSYLRRTSTEVSASELYVEDAASGKRERVVDSQTARTSLKGYVWSPDGKTLLLNGKGELGLYDVGRKALDVLVKDEVEFPSFSPDGSHVAFVRKHNLYVFELAIRKETALSSDGDEHVFNGRLDWVYEEELAERSGRAYEWAPDSGSLAFLRLDENRVPAYPLVNFLSLPHAASQP